VNTYYNVRPRYTSGSPAMVDAQTAARVAKQEKAAYEDALSGQLGVELRERAEREGCRGIAERVMRERRQNRVNGFDVYDLILCQEYWRPQRRANDLDAEPECLYVEDHQIDPASLKLVLNADQTVAIAGTCKLCKNVGHTDALGLRFEVP